MTSTLECLREYIGSWRAWWTNDRTQPTGPSTEPACEQPYTRVFRLLAITMLFG